MILGEIQLEKGQKKIEYIIFIFFILTKPASKDLVLFVLLRQSKNL